MRLGNIDGLYLLLFLIPLIILYLIKAKPKKIVMPSLIFLSEDKKVKKYSSILQKFLYRFLILIQALMIIIVALASANPIVKIPLDAYSLNTVVVMDVSASMGTKEGTIPRMDLGKKDLLKQVKGDVSIILAEENPIVIATNVSSSKARALITNINSKNTKGRLDGSIILAQELLGEDKGNIVVYSDFIVEDGDDIEAAKKVAEANDKRVMFIGTGSKRSNIGWMSLSFSRGGGEALIKNYGQRSENVDIKVTKEGATQTTRISLSPYSVEKINFEVGRGVTTLETVSKDRLEVDDKIDIINPYDDKVDILVITNELDSPILDALRANPSFQVDIAEPPIIPDINSDIVIFAKVNANQLLPNTFRDIKKFTDNGGKAVIMAQSAIEGFNFQGLLSTRILSPKFSESNVCVEIINEYTKRMDNCFTNVLRYNPTVLGTGIALASTESNDPILVLEKNVLYYGIIDQFSGFTQQINYPLFWDDVVNNMLGRESLANYNYKTGDIMFIGNESRKVILDTAGVQTISGREVAVNLLSNEESDIFRDSELLADPDLSQVKEKVNLDVNIDSYLLLLAGVILLFEVYYIKRRGDL